MKKRMLFTTIFFVFLLVMGTTAMSTPIPIEPFDLNTPYNVNISATGSTLDELDWLPGSGLAVNANAIGPGGAADPFMFLAQVKLGGIIASDGTNLTPPTLNGIAGLPTPYEYTMVTRLWETATGLGTGSATFDLVADPTGTNPNILEIYADTYVGGATPLVPAPGVQSNVPNGTGFTDGQLILTAVPVELESIFGIADTNGNGVLDNQDSGTGSSQVVYEITSYDSNFWTFDDAPKFIYTQFDGTLTMPPAGVDTAQMWDGTVPDYYEGTPGTDPTQFNDLFFKVDGNSHFAVPEPSSILLLGTSLLGLAGFARRRFKK